MRSLRLLLAASLLTPMVGCKWLEEMRKGGPKPPNKNTSAIQPVTAEQLVTYLNAQADRLKSVSYSEVTLSAKEGDGLRGAIREMTYPSLRGYLTASQPRNFRMIVDGALAAKVDLGSNPEQFWVSAHIPSQQPLFVYASHTDFENGQAKLPGGIPFEPDWILQALNMTTFPLDAPYEMATLPASPATPQPGAVNRGPQRSVPINEKDRTYILRWQTVTPSKVPIIKEVIFAADDTDASRNEPQVKKHIIRDTKGKLLAYAEVKSAKTFPTGGTDPKGRPYVVQVPTHVVLRYEEQKFEMTLKLDMPRVNQPMSQEDTRRLFSRPNVPGVPAVNLAEARFDGGK